MHSLLRTLLFVCRLRYPHYPAFYFPVYLIVKFLQEFDFKFNTRKLNFQLVPVPNRYFDFLARDHDIQSDHTIFINRRVFDYYIYQKDVNFINMHLSEISRRSTMSHAERVIKEVVESSKAADANMNLYQVFPLDNLPINKVLVKENSFWNFVDKHKVVEEGSAQVIVNLSMLQGGQKIPAIATKCNVFLINSAYEVPNAFVDDVLREYFRRPRLLYRNHTYR
jgi:peroxin-6